MKCSALLPLVPFLLINSTNGTSDGHIAPALRGQVSRDRNTPRRLARKPKPPKETTTTTQPTSACNERRLHLDADEWQQHRILPRGGGGGKKNNEVTTTTTSTTEAPPPLRKLLQLLLPRRQCQLQMLPPLKLHPMSVHLVWQVLMPKL